MDLVPINGCVVVELTGELTMIEMPDKQYSTNTSGIVKAVDEAELPDLYYLVGKRVYFEGFKDVEVPGDDVKYAFVKIEDIRGYEQTE
jgi:co-chaperonin GroES (HSP10)